MNLLSLVSSGTDFQEAQYAVIALDRELAKRLLRLREKCKSLFRLKGFLGAKFYDYSPEIYEEEAPDRLEVHDWMDQPAGFVIPENSMSCDLGIVVVKKDGVLWRMSIKHSSETAETNVLDWDTIKRVAKGKA